MTTTKRHTDWGSIGKQGILALALTGAFGCAQVWAGTTPSSAQNALARQLESFRGKPEALRHVSLFRPQSQPVAADRKAAAALHAGTLLEIDPAALADLQRTRPQSITLTLPGGAHGPIELELFRNDIFAPGFKVQTSGHEDTRRVNLGVHYRGVIKGDGRSFAAISVFDHQVIGSFANRTLGSWTIGRLSGSNPSNRHVLYAEDNLRDKRRAPRCDMDRDPASYLGHGTAARPIARADGDTRCATEWLEAEYDIFQSKGSVQAVTEYLTGVFNNSSALYANDGIKLKLSQLFIWTTEDPYNGSDTGSNLTSFQNYRASSFVGTIAQLVTFRSLGGGVAAGFWGVCNRDRSASMSTSAVIPDYSTVPNFSWSVEVTTHEAGHLLGSRHTHACVWNGNNSAIDGCAGYVEGSCALPGVPAGGGTIMSYCHLTNAGINFNLGFGAQPAQAIRSQIEGGTCLSGCEDGDGSKATALQNHTPVSGIAAAANADKIYKIEVPAGSQALAVTTWGGRGDADIYVKQGSVPTQATYTCKSTNPDNNESCRIDNPAPGTWYILLHPYSQVALMSLNASVAGGCDGSLSLGVLQNKGAVSVWPDSGWYQSSTAGLHAGTTTGPAGADFDLTLQRWGNNGWSMVANSVTPASAESIRYNGTPGYYRWLINADNGTGGYSLCVKRPQ